MLISKNNNNNMKQMENRDKESFINNKKSISSALLFLEVTFSDAGNAARGDRASLIVRFSASSTM